MLSCNEHSFVYACVCVDSSEMCELVALPPERTDPDLSLVAFGRSQYTYSIVVMGGSVTVSFD